MGEGPSKTNWLKKGVDWNFVFKLKLKVAIELNFSNMIL